MTRATIPTLPFVSLSTSGPLKRRKPAGTLSSCLSSAHPPTRLVQFCGTVEVHAKKLRLPLQTALHKSTNGGANARGLLKREQRGPARAVKNSNESFAGSRSMRLCMHTGRRPGGRCMYIPGVLWTRDGPGGCDNTLGVEVVVWKNLTALPVHARSCRERRWPEKGTQTCWFL